MRQRGRRPRHAWRRCAAPLLALGAAVACTQPQRPPDVFFIVIDTLRADHLSSYGYPRETAPTLQRLADQGVLFERVIAPSSWTKTSMASIMTAQSPDGHGVRGTNDRLPDDRVTLSERFSEGGFHTIGVHANPWLRDKFGFGRGFDVYRSMKFHTSGFELNREALGAIAEAPHDRPIFVYLHYMDVHAPYTPGADFFRAESITLPDGTVLADSRLEYRYRKERLDGPGVQQRVLDLYDAEIRTADEAIAELLNALREIGRYDNSMLVITSDHGEGFREHGTTEHGWNLYPEVLEIPLIFFAPGRVPPGHRVPSQVRAIDIAPTLLELAGLTAQESFEGQSLLPLTEPIAPRIAIAAVGLNDYIPDLDYTAVITARHLYIHERTLGRVEFYDLTRDPAAQRDLGRSHPEAAALARLETEGSTRPDEVELDPETEEQLRALGYLQ